MLLLLLFWFPLRLSIKDRNVPNGRFPDSGFSFTDETLASPADVSLRGGSSNVTLSLRFCEVFLREDGDLRALLGLVVIFSFVPSGLDSGSLQSDDGEALQTSTDLEVL